MEPTGRLPASAPLANGETPRARLRRYGLPALAIAGLALAVGLSFFSFARTVTGAQIPSRPAADAIVVLTGDAHRIGVGMDLLQAGAAGRLLISGVHEATTRAAIASVTGDPLRFFSCCVDLDHVAMNTRGNAEEAGRWVEANAYGSLIVVTSAYHMPRALAEFRAVMPQAELIGYPVVSEVARADNWWQSGAGWRLLVSEYLKYQYARLRLALS
ncbi:MAG: YdcF family protein [Hyphomicrobiaceae bacterium]|nr:YdcF family protein [Hyphomicrobiaceae bacterium]